MSIPSNPTETRPFDKAVADWFKTDFVSALNPQLDKLIARLNAATTPPSTLAKAAAKEIVPVCLSRTCFIQDCHRNRCWGCDEAKKERERVAAIVERCLAGGMGHD